jgi:hypothetical protein
MAIGRNDNSVQLVPKKLLNSVRKYVKPKPISRQNQKLTQQHNWKKVTPANAKRVYLFLHLSFHLAVKAKRGI